MDFAYLPTRLARWGAPASWPAQVDMAGSSLLGGDYTQARTRLQSLMSSVTLSPALPAWRQQDAQAILHELMRRVDLVELGLVPAAGVVGPAARAARF